MKISTVFLVTIIISFLAISCNEKELIQEFKTGFWRGEITMQEQQLPFVFEVLKSNDQFSINLHDGASRMEMDKIRVENDSVFFTIGIFDIDVKAKIENNSLYGIYTKNFAENYELPFKATFAKKNRLDNAKSDPVFNGKWDIDILKKNGDTIRTIGMFNTDDALFKGTIISKSGDFRFLEGTSENGDFTLYSFDGDNLKIFKAHAEGDQLVGEYWSGKTLHRTFIGKRNKNATLPDPSTLTYLKEGFDKIEFSFPDLDGNQVTLNNAKYQDKVVILQIFGTWCPNCMDETIFFKEWLDNHKKSNVEIIGLAYENKPDFEYAKKRVEKMKEKLEVSYDFVIAGTSSNMAAGKTLPMLNHVMSFPTSIIIDKMGKVRKIHTGFSGPATGDYYLEYTKEFNSLMSELIAE